MTPLTTDPEDEGLRQTRPDGQQHAYLVLSEAERLRGFVRPLRTTYRHVGPEGPRYPTRPLDDDERARYAGVGYVAFEPYPPQGSGPTGRYWTRAQLDAVGKGCGTATTMALAIAETYARNPGFYGATYCAGCRTHLPVGRDGEFVWADGGERVGT